MNSEFVSGQYKYSRLTHNALHSPPPGNLCVMRFMHYYLMHYEQVYCIPVYENYTIGRNNTQ